VTTANGTPLSVAFVDSGKAGWTGGETYRANLLEALGSYAPQLEVYLVTNASAESNGARHYKTFPLPFANHRIVHLANRFLNLRLGYDHLLRNTLAKTPRGGVDVVFPGPYGVGNGAALLYWIPDFQFLHLPDMYTKTAIAGIVSSFKRGARRASLVVLSSEDAKRDFCAFVPEMVDKARVMNFVSRVPSSVYEKDARDILCKYSLPERFIYLPNQFWKHKNHILVLDALRILKGKGVRPFVAFTGNPIDSRDPAFFAELLQTISVWGLREQVAFLGLVPHDDVFSLIRQSVCVLNPSLFEGWSTTVEETKSIGKRILLSDISVHREQNPPASIYFDPRNAEALAKELHVVWNDAKAGPDVELESAAQRSQPARMRAFAETFVAIAGEAARLAKVRG
jgi:glycosyltransferase involved in cell wall biosynthesis